MNEQNVIIISGHPNLESSKANRTIIEEINLLKPEYEIDRLDSLYPDFNIDVKTEQSKLINANIIVWQFPLQWFSTPAIFKKYLDDVYIHGFAYGSTGTYLKGKKIILSITAGGAGEEYSYENGYNHPIEDFLFQFVETFNYTNLEYAGFIFSPEMDYFEGISSAEKLEDIIKRARMHAHKLIEMINKA